MNNYRSKEKKKFNGDVSEQSKIVLDSGLVIYTDKKNVSAVRRRHEKYEKERRKYK